MESPSTLRLPTRAALEKTTINETASSSVAEPHWVRSLGASQLAASAQQSVPGPEPALALQAQLTPARRTRLAAPYEVRPPSSPGPDLARFNLAYKIRMLRGRSAEAHDLDTHRPRRTRRDNTNGTASHRNKVGRAEAPG
jgi:hypothetical protein